MGRLKSTLCIRICFFFTMVLCAGCTDSAIQIDDEVLIKVENKVITIREFKQTFEIAKAAYSPSALRKPKIRERALYDVLWQLTDELVILNRAAELNLAITDEELNRKVELIKSDYPDDTFNHMLIEQSISFSIWEKRMKTRLLMEKVVKRDLEDRQKISAEDISTYMRGHQKNLQGSAKGTDGIRETPEEVIYKLRQKKAQESYQSWISKLRDRYTIYVDQELWERITR